MRYITLEEGDTLENIASRFYRDPHADKTRTSDPSRAAHLRETVSAAIKSTPENAYINWDDLQPHQKLLLPNISGVELRDPVRDFWRYTNWFIAGVAALTLACGAVRVSLDLIYPVLTGLFKGISDTNVQHYLLMALAGRPITSLNSLQLFLSLLLIIFALWFFHLPKSIRVSTTINYIVIWIGGGIILAVLSNLVLFYLVTVTAKNDSFIDTLDLLAVWTIIIGIFYVVAGDNSDGYRANIQEHKSIAISFLLTVLFTFLLLNYTFDYINHRVQGLLAPRELLTSHLDDAADSLGQVQIHALTLQKQLKSNTLSQDSTLPIEPSSACSSTHPAGAKNFDGGSSANTLVASQTSDTPSELYAICAYLANATVSTQSAIDLYAPVVTAENELFTELESGSTVTSTGTVTDTDLVSAANTFTGTNMLSGANPSANLANRLGASLQWTHLAAEDTLALTQEINQTLTKLQDQLSHPATPERDTTAVAIVTDELLPQVEQANAAAAQAASAVHGVEIDPRPLFNGTASLLVLFVLFPWFLLLLFFLRKRTSLASDIVNDLIRLSPDHALLKRVLGLIDIEIKQDTRAPAEFFDAVRATDFTLQGIVPDQIRQQVELYKSVRAMPNSAKGAIRATNLPAGVRGFETVRVALANHAFRDLEYVLAITMLSGTFAVGWYFVIYPKTSVGLALLILENTGIIGFVQYLATNLTTVTAGFAGAYLWSAYVLLRRYYYGDLYPTAYLGALERTIRVFIITLILGVVAGLITLATGGSANTATHPAVLGLAFFIGIFPQVGLTFLGDLINRTVSANIPSTIERAPLTELDGLDYYVEGRLLEENIENVQGMATAQIEDLVVHTFFPPKRIVDWIDQSILYIHCGRKAEWFPLFRGAGIRTASDLLDVLGYDRKNGPPSNLEGRNVETALVTQLVEAIRAAQVSTVTPSLTPAENTHRDVMTYWSKMGVVTASGAILNDFKTAIGKDMKDAAARKDAEDSVAPLKTSNQDRDSALSAFLTWSGKIKKDLEAWEELPEDDKSEITQRLDKVEVSVQTVAAASAQVTGNLNILNLDDPTSIKAMQDAIQQLADATAVTSDQARDAYDAILVNYAPPPLSAEIILEIYDALWPDPNMTYILNWQQES